MSKMIVTKVSRVKLILRGNHYSAVVSQKVIDGKTFETDSYTNLSESVISRFHKNLYKEKYHPLCLLKERIVQFFYNRFKNKKGNSLFCVIDDLSPIVTTQQNFDSLLIPKNHPSRSKTDCYYINKEWMLRAHMTAHQADLIKSGLDNFLMIGDVYRRDHVDSCHYDIFHQIDGVRLLTPEELFVDKDDGVVQLRIKPNEICQRTEYLQENYTEEATKLVEAELKRTLEDLSKDLFGNEIQYKWVDAYFPFTHPSWELEILQDDAWVEILGCGVMEHQILKNGGCDNRIGWAFGLGLERLAMAYYSIPDIRIFWSTDPGFHHQFEGKTWADKLTFKPFSCFPPSPYDLSFWINDSFDSQDFYTLAREHCGDVLEQIKLIDVYKSPKTGKESRCYRLVYRSMEKTFTKKELNKIHAKLVEKLVAQFNVTVR